MKNTKKIIFIGTVIFSKKILLKLLSMNVKIELIICKKKSLFNSDFADLSSIAVKNNINYHNTDNINSKKTEKIIRAVSPDVIFCFGWSQLIHKNILNIPSLGIVGFHPSNIKLNRGCNPITWALVLGLKKTASTFFWINKRIDNGKIINVKDVKILNNDNANSLYNRIIKTAYSQIPKILKEINNKNLKFVNKVQQTGIYWRRRKFADGQIDWRMRAVDIHNLIKGLSNPYVGAHFIYKKQLIKVWKSKKTEKKLPYYVPGQIINVSKKNVEIKCGEGTIIIDKIDKVINFKINGYIE